VFCVRTNSTQRITSGTGQLLARGAGISKLSYIAAYDVTAATTIGRRSKRS